MRPKFALLRMLVFRGLLAGACWLRLLKRVQLNALNASIRASARCVPNRNAPTSERSTPFYSFSIDRYKTGPPQGFIPPITEI